MSMLYLSFYFIINEITHQNIHLYISVFLQVEDELFALKWEPSDDSMVSLALAPFLVIRSFSVWETMTQWVVFCGSLRN